MIEPEPADSAKFFEYGEVVFEERDFPSRTAAIRICVPNCLFQAVTPALLGAGLIDQFTVRDPIAAWVPMFTDARMIPHASELVDNACAQMNATASMVATSALRAFHSMARLLNNPSDLVPILPLGVYVTLRFRCRIDDIPKVLFGIQGIPVDGVAEFQWALASVLACVLQDMRTWEQASERLPQGL